MNPAKLDQANGEVEEEKMDKVAESAERSPTSRPAKPSRRIRTDPRQVRIFCNLPGHYAGGMYELTVTE